jgi:hypothetical protein
MLRNRVRKNIATLPFRIRNNFRRQSQGTIVPSNDDDEIVLHAGSGDKINFNNNYGNEMLVEQRNNHDDDVDMLSENEEYDNYENVESEEYDDYENAESEEYDDHEDAEREVVYITSSESDSNTASSEDEGENNDNPSSEEKIFVDRALDESNLPNFNGNFAPYFQDFTTAALFCWIHKHNISTNAYEDLVDIIMNQEFNRNHIVRNIRRFRTWRQHLPLLSISAKSIPISSKKTPSTSKNSKLAYQLSINDIIWHVLSNPSLVNNMYFGPGIDSEIKSEYWHGTLWAESPLFGQEQLTILQGNDHIIIFVIYSYS